MKKNSFLVGFILLISTASGVVASKLAANELGDSGNWSAWDKNNSTGGKYLWKRLMEAGFLRAKDK